MILRAELRYEGRTIVAHTSGLTPRSTFVRTDERLSPGERILVSLSFPGFMAPLELAAKVVLRQEQGLPGDSAGIELEFLFSSEEQEMHLARLVAHPAASEANTREDETVCRILVVEDSAIIRDMVLVSAQKCSRNGGRKVHADVAESVEQAWELLQRQGYDLAVVDLYLTGSQSGADLVRRMRAQPKLAQVPVVGISVGGGEAREAFMFVGVDIFLDKPVILRDLFSTLQRLTQLEDSMVIA